MAAVVSHNNKIALALRAEEIQLQEGEQLIRSFDYVLVRELSGLLIRRLFLLHLLFAVLDLTAAVYQRLSPVVVGIGVLTALGAELVLLKFVGAARSRRELERVASLSIVLGSVWIAGLVAAHLSPAAILAALLLFSLSIFMMPWSAPAAFFHAIFAVGGGFSVWVTGFFGQPVSWPALLALTSYVVVSLLWARLSAEHGLSAAARAAQRVLGEYCESTSAVALLTLRLMASQSLRIFSSGRALICPESGNSEVLVGARILKSGVDPVYCKGLLQRLRDLSIEQGFVRVREFGEQFRAPFHDWFSRVPRSVYALRLLMVVENREQEVTVLVPLTIFSRLCGPHRCARAVRTLVSLARIALSAARNRFLASDSLFLSQQSLSERDTELNEIVHLVNNVAQDMAMQCEDLSAAASAMRGDTGSHATKFVEGVHDLEIAVRNLSAGVSDRKLLKELVRLRNFRRIEHATLPPLLEDLRTFGLYRARRRGDKFALVADLKPGTSVRVVSREYLETCLRALVRESFGAKPGATDVEVRVRADEGMLRFEILGAIAESIVEEFGKETEARSESPVQGALEAVGNFAALSEGKFTLQSAAAPFTSMCILTLREAEERPAKLVARGRWALFVDDNPQVTTFYGRIADALSLPFFTAASVSEARRLIAREGAPRLVVTDLQLGEESGLDLVRALRRDFKAALPIIVVSGNVAEEVRTEVRQAGATNVLAKPVGRARLLAEIQSLMDGK